jgi:hypothetical protein
MRLPGTAAWRRRAAVGCLAFGAVLAGRAVSRDLPHEQTLVFRLDESARHTPLKLSASVLRIGESEARAGFTLVRDGAENGDPTERLRLPNGDYLVTIELEYRERAPEPSAAKEGETSRVERVTLSGGETVVPLRRRVAE